jgi:Spx/MgsR family transcriptional regulator
MEKLTVYGIPNCDITKKAFSWLKQHKIEFAFHDYKKEGIGESKLKDWCVKVGWEKLLNKKSTTWRGLSEAEQARITSQPEAIKTMMQHNSIIKRPVIEFKGKVFVGYDEASFSKYFLSK